MGSIFISNLTFTGILNHYYEIKRLILTTATVKELDSLPGIGPTMAKRIEEYRQSKGAFTSIEDIKHVKGIGDGYLRRYAIKLQSNLPIYLTLNMLITYSEIAHCILSGIILGIYVPIDRIMYCSIRVGIVCLVQLVIYYIHC